MSGVRRGMNTGEQTKRKIAKLLERKGNIKRNECIEEKDDAV
jgi:hypothetical protein